jgi:FAD-dependent oxidoreductase family protein
MLNERITIPENRIPLSGTYDVVVVGGGIAGVAAAVAAARNGASVCLLEKEIALGGLATLGNVIVYLPLCDGMGNQVIKGLGEEMLKLSIKDNQGPTPGLNRKDIELPECWSTDEKIEGRKEKRYQVSFNPASYMLALEEFVLQNGVKLLYDTRFCNVVKEQQKITHVVIENKSGRSAIRCSAVIDASGDADVCATAGEATESLDTNVRAGWFYYTENAELKLCCLSDPYDPEAKIIPEGAMGFSGDNADDVTSQVVTHRNKIREKIQSFREESPGQAIYPAILPTFPGFRMTRRLKGYEITSNEAENRLSDLIGMTGDWRKRGPVYHLSYQTITAKKCSNLLSAGRCISIGNDLWDVTRVIPVCAVTGEAAGTAAALSVKEYDGNVQKLPITVLQKQLKAQEVIL